ncbi:GNAT family N-acetyltransferase [Acrocarpospora pleiomorpha]|uniref:GNAT family N-acetyltransferase n=1 Tax=Acrocarpospora pleiomorpha TaxID=90975 RepID=UPI0031E2F3CC
MTAARACRVIDLYGMNANPYSSVLVREVTPDDQPEFIELARSSLAMHRQWISMPTTPAAFAAYVNRFDGVAAVGLVVCLRSTGELAGIVNLRPVNRDDPLRRAIGFGAFSGMTGRGYMREGVELTLHIAFHRLNLDGLEADIQPGNTACLNLVKRLGFRRQDCSVPPIWIDGSWRHHERWTITREMCYPGILS